MANKRADMKIVTKKELNFYFNLLLDILFHTESIFILNKFQFL